MSFNLGHNEGEANNLAREGLIRAFGAMADCGALRAMLASTRISKLALAPAQPCSRSLKHSESPEMTDENKTAAQGNEAANQTEQTATEARIVGQFIRDLSFENPNIERLLASPGDAPNVKLEINVAAKRLQPDLYESAIDFKAVASNAEGTIYDLELVYAGLFQLKNIPEQALEPFLLINCPTLIFPFLRRLVADLTREGGFPPLMLDPIDFGQLFVRRKNELAAAGATGKPN